MVRTSLTAGKLGCIGQFIDLFDTKHCCLVICFVAFTRNQSGSECTHDSGNIRTGSVYAGNLLEASKYSVVVEGSTLYNDILAEILGIGEFNNLE